MFSNRFFLAPALPFLTDIVANLCCCTWLTLMASISPSVMTSFLPADQRCIPKRPVIFPIVGNCLSLVRIFWPSVLPLASLKVATCIGSPLLSFVTKYPNLRHVASVNFRDLNSMKSPFKKELAAFVFSTGGFSPSAGVCFRQLKQNICPSL